MKIGLDWGGTKLEVIALDPITNEELARNRIDSPKDNYQKILNTVCSLITDTAGQEKEITVGIGMPGSLHPKTGLVQVSNTKVLEGQDVKNDLENKLGLNVRIANDADCLALSESVDGSGKNYRSVFAVIIGTGVGAGYVIEKQLVVGPNKLTGEWGITREVPKSRHGFPSSRLSTPRWSSSRWTRRSKPATSCASRWPARERTTCRHPPARSSRSKRAPHRT